MVNAIMKVLAVLSGVGLQLVVSLPLSSAHAAEGDIAPSVTTIKRGKSLMAFSVSEATKQNTLGQSEGFPEGVPHSWNWYQGWNDDGLKIPPSDFTSVTGWGQIYQEEGQPANSDPNANVEIANAKTYVHLTSGEWVLVQDQATNPVVGGHFVTDFSGNAGYNMTPEAGSDGSVAFDAPPAGYNNHFWPDARGTYEPGTVDAVYVQMDMRATDPGSNLVASVGADWWRDANAPYLDDHSTNPGVGSSNWVELSTEWRTLAYYSSPSLLESDPPPPLADLGTVGETPTTPVDPTDPTTPPDSANPGTPTDPTDPSTPPTDSAGPGTPTDPTNPTTPPTDSAGPVTPTDPTDPATPPTSSPTEGVNLLKNGSFEATPVDANRWAGFDSIEGWTAISGGTIELWNDLNGVQATDGLNFGELDYLDGTDGFYQDVKTESGQKYELSFDARSRFPGATSTIEVLWNDEVVAEVPPGSDWSNYKFNVDGTGGDDRLTFREAEGEGQDGLGALYDNVKLVATNSAGSPSDSAGSPSDPTDNSSDWTCNRSHSHHGGRWHANAGRGHSNGTRSDSTGSTSPAGSSEMNRAMDLVNQYSAATSTNSSAAETSVFDQNKQESLAPTLAQSQH